MKERGENTKIRFETDLKNFASRFGIKMPENRAIIDRVLELILDEFNGNVDEIKAHYDELVTRVESLAYDVYLNYQRDYGYKVLSALGSYLLQTGSIVSAQDIPDALGDSFETLDSFFLSLGQSRKARAGKVFEQIHSRLFSMLGYPFTEQPVIGGKPDFVMPSIEAYKVMSMECIIFTAKRTLRERWRQIVTEGTGGAVFYLATIDQNITEQQFYEMKRHKIYVVVPKSIKDSKYTLSNNVISFGEFFTNHLDHKMKLWKESGMI